MELRETLLFDSLDEKGQGRISWEDFKWGLKLRFTFMLCIGGLHDDVLLLCLLVTHTLNLVSVLLSSDYYNKYKPSDKLLDELTDLAFDLATSNPSTEFISRADWIRALSKFAKKCEGPSV